MVDERTRKVIEHGRRIRVILGQRQFEPLLLGEQVALLLALAEGLLDDLPLELVGVFKTKVGPWLTQNFPDAIRLDDQAEVLPGEFRERLKATLTALVRSILVASQQK